jgi:peptide/nickel transport system ATP-binding protein
MLRMLDEVKGQVLFEGKNILDLPKSELRGMRRHMQIVFQDPVGSLSPRMKVRQIVGEGLTIHFKDLSKADRHKKVDDVLNLVGLSPAVADRFPHEFSGGQRQRIAIARALVLEPEFLVLDEPTSALDVSVQAQILNLLEKIQASRGLAYLFITHDLGVVEYIADQVAVMYLGHIIERASTSELFSNPRHPYTKTLLEAVPGLVTRSMSSQTLRARSLPRWTRLPAAIFTHVAHWPTSTVRMSRQPCEPSTPHPSHATKPLNSKVLSQEIALPIILRRNQAK